MKEYKILPRWITTKVSPPDANRAGAPIVDGTAPTFSAYLSKDPTSWPAQGDDPAQLHHSGSKPLMALLWPDCTFSWHNKSNPAVTQSVATTSECQSLPKHPTVFTQAQHCAEHRSGVHGYKVRPNAPLLSPKYPLTMAIGET